MKISAAVILTAMICVPVTATVIGSDAYTLNVAGSTTVQPLMVEFQKEFEKFANVEMNVTGGGSGVGVSSTLNGVADIGMLSRDLHPNEVAAGLAVREIAKDAVIVIVNISAGLPPDAGGMPTLTLQGLVDIYSGKVTNWAELGGANMPIKAISREEGSGTRDCFDSALKAADSSYKIKERDILALNNTNAVLTTVNDIDGAIGYVNYNVAHGTGNRTVCAKVSATGRGPWVEATDITIKNGTYPISRNLILVTNGEPDGIVKLFLDWIMSEDGQNIVEEAGFVRWS